jgi:hypothetical protein
VKARAIVVELRRVQEIGVGFPRRFDVSKSSVVRMREA